MKAPPSVITGECRLCVNDQAVSSFYSDSPFVSRGRLIDCGSDTDLPFNLVLIVFMKSDAQDFPTDVKPNHRLNLIPEHNPSLLASLLLHGSLYKVMLHSQQFPNQNVVSTSCFSISP